MSIENGDLVQITNEENPWFPCVLVVSELKSWGIQGYVTIPLKGDAYYRVKTGEFELVGKAKIEAG